MNPFYTSGILMAVIVMFTNCVNAPGLMQIPPVKINRLSSLSQSWVLTCQFILFIYLGFYVAFNTVQVISQRVVGRAEETSTYSWSRFCTVNCRPMASNYQLSHLRPCREPNPSLRWEARVLPLCHCGPPLTCQWQMLRFYIHVTLVQALS